MLLHPLSDLCGNRPLGVFWGNTCIGSPRNWAATKVLNREKLFSLSIEVHWSHRIIVAGYQTRNGERRNEYLQVEAVSYRPPGTEVNLLNGVTFSLPEKSLGLVYGSSGSGKTTLLQVLAGLASPNEGSVTINQQVADKVEQGLLCRRVGIVFQFPERYFLADTILEELTFGQPSWSQKPFLKQQLYMQLHKAVLAVGLSSIAWNANPRSLSDGYKRRLSLAVQLVCKPDLLLLDEPLAGLDWRARMDVVNLLSSLKKEITLIVVSHDLKELNCLVDRAWRMDLGGYLTEQPWPL